MRIIVTVMLVLIAEVLSFTNAAEMNVQEESCVKYGGNMALTNLRTSGERAKAYFNSVHAEFMGSLARNPSQPELAFAKVCDRVKDQSIANHWKDVIKSTKACVDKTIHQGLDVVLKILNSMIQFACNNVQLLLKAITSPERNCIASKREAWKSCSDVFTGLVLKSNTLSDMTDILMELKPTFDTETCSKILNFEQCTIKVMKQCKDEVFPELLNNIYKDINENIPCDNLPTLTRSGASPTSVVSFMTLFIFLITVSL